MHLHDISNATNLGGENATHLTRGGETATRGGSPLTNKHLNDFHNLKFENGNDCPDDLENSIESPSPRFNAAEKETIDAIPKLPLYNSQFRRTGETASNANSSNRIRGGEEMIYNIITDEYFQ